MEFMTASEQIGALRARRVSAAELLEQSMARIDAHDGAVNAVIVRDHERARRTAAQADVALTRGDPARFSACR